MDRVRQIIGEFPPAEGAYLTVVAFDATGREQKIGRADLGSPAEGLAWVKGVLDNEGRKPGIEKCRVRLWGPGGSSGPSVMCRWNESTADHSSHPAPSKAGSPSAPGRAPSTRGTGSHLADEPSPALVAGQCPRCRRLEAELREARLEIRSLTSRNESNVIVVNEEMEKNRRLEKKFAPMQAILRRTQAERDSLVETNSRLRERIAELKRQVGHLNAELQDAQAANAAWERGVSKLNAMMDGDADDEDEDEDCDEDESWEEDE